MGFGVVCAIINNWQRTVKGTFCLDLARKHLRITHIYYYGFENRIISLHERQRIKLNKVINKLYYCIMTNDE